MYTCSEMDPSQRMAIDFYVLMSIDIMCIHALPPCLLCFGLCCGMERYRRRRKHVLFVLKTEPRKLRVWLPATLAAASMQQQPVPHAQWPHSVHSAVKVKLKTAIVWIGAT